MPEELAVNIEHWKIMHPNWGVTVWTERDLCWLRNRQLFDDAENIVPRDAVEQFRSDVARYEIILEYGGFYADVDTWPLKNIGDSLAKHETFAVWEDRSWIGNTYLGGMAKSPVFKAIVNGLAANVKRHRGRRPNVLSGPKYITPLWKLFDAYAAPTSWGFPYSYTHVKRNTVPRDFDHDTHVVHQWHHTKKVTEAQRGR